MEQKFFESLYPPKTREKEIGEIVELLKSGKSCQLCGLPGVGKSTVLKLLAYNKNIRLHHFGENQKQVHFVYMDFSEVKKRPFFDVLKFILISLSYSLSARRLTAEQNTVNALLKDSLTFKDELILFQALKHAVDFLAIEKKLSIVFLFDRFDEYTPEINENFFLNLKILRNRAKYRFGCIFATTRPLEEILEVSFFSEFYEFVAGNIVYSQIYDATGLTFRISYLEKSTGKKTSPTLKNALIEATGGHGKLTRTGYESLLTQNLQPKNLLPFLLEKPSVQASLYELWQALTPQEQSSLLTGGENNVFLEKSGLLKKSKITIPLFEEFIKNIPLANVAKIAFDSDKNAIVQDGEDITEKLSPSEFKLLKFLILQRGKICEKEEIINFVWNEEKTREGVTDQALDQIVYRLRKKIEKDPNNPTLLQTIKGRGYKITGEDSS